MTARAPIGIFDSGLGGLTVMRALQTLLPQENILYFGDTAHLPYGNKSPQELLAYTEAACRFFERHQVKCLIVACHTASAIALPLLSSTFSFPIRGMCQEALDAVYQAAPTTTHNLAILGTEATIRSHFYQNALSLQLPQATLFPLSCPTFVPLIEEGLSALPSSLSAIQSALAPLHSHPIDIALLACTHYPLLLPTLQSAFKTPPQFIDPAVACAKTLAQFLHKYHLLNPQIDAPHHHFYVSQLSPTFSEQASLFLGHPVLAEEVALTTAHL